jgi:hypothetical protein
MTGENLLDYQSNTLLRAAQVAARVSISAVALVGVQSFNAQPSLAEGPQAAHVASSGSCAEDATYVDDFCISPNGEYTPANNSSPSHDAKHYSLNMHKYNKILSARGCGILALSTAISFQRQKETSPYKVWDRVDNVFTKSGEIKKNEYMRVAAPQAAKHYGLKAHQSSLDFTISNIEQGASVIMLATGSPDGTITRSSHYFEADEAKNGKVHIHDPNQKPGRKFNDSWRSIGWLKKHNTRDHTWVIESE